MKVSRDKKTGKASRVTWFTNRWFIETWYDRSTRDFVTQVFDADRYERKPDALLEYGGCIRSGTATGAKLNHQDLVNYVKETLQ